LRIKSQKQMADGLSCPVCGGRIETPDFITSADMRLLVRNGNAAKLTKREFQVFECLNRKPYKVFTRGQIIEYIYGLEHDEPDWRILLVFLNRMRKKLKPLGILIENEYNVGYRLRFATT
jgi:DNA-binding response OmpR family regulator